MAVIHVAATIQTSSGVTLDAKPGRQFIACQNLDASNEIHLHFGQDDATASNGVRVGPGEYVEFNGQDYSNPLHTIAISGAVAEVIGHD